MVQPRPLHALESPAERLRDGRGAGQAETSDVGEEMNKKLKPCPFCGRKRLKIKTTNIRIHGRYTRYGHWYVLCRNCEVNSPWRKTERGAITVWNTRKNIKVLEEEIEALKWDRDQWRQTADNLKQAKNQEEK